MITFLFALLLSLPTPLEDQPLFNCHVHGNAVCGPDAPAHGFVNLDGF